MEINRYNSYVTNGPRQFHFVNRSYFIVDEHCFHLRFMKQNEVQSQVQSEDATEMNNFIIWERQLDLPLLFFNSSTAQEVDKCLDG